MRKIMDFKDFLNKKDKKIINESKNIKDMKLGLDLTKNISDSYALEKTIK